MRRSSASVVDAGAPLVHYPAGDGPALGRDALEICSRHEGLRLILAHAGISDLAWIWREAPDHPNLFFDTSWWSPADVQALLDDPATAEEFRRRVSIRAPSVDTPASALSGGNQQKVVLAKWLFTESQLLIFDEPTRGIDVGSKVEIYQLMNALTAKGVGILTYQADRDNLRRDAGDWHEGVRTAAGSPPASLRTKGPAVTTKSDFTEEEWEQLRKGATGAGLLVSVLTWVLAQNRTVSPARAGPSQNCRPANHMFPDDGTT